MQTDWHEQISQPEYEVELEEDVLVSMRDGIRLSVDIYRPKGKGKFPALVSFSGFGKDQQKLPTSPVWQPSNRLRGTGGHECGEQWYFVPRGYVQVIPDPRGVGKSEGESTLAYGQDGYDLIEWIARQPWCNGNVGMLGMSAFCWAQYQIAGTQPPHLKAIFPFEGASDSYRHGSYHGGILDFLGQMGANTCPSRVPGAVIGGVPRPTKVDDLTEDQIKSRIAELQNDPDIQCTPWLYALTLRPEIHPRLFGMLMHPFDGPYYQKMSGQPAMQKIKIPAYCGSRWDGWGMHLPGAFDAWDSLGTTDKLKKMLMIPVGMDRPFHEVQDVCLRWYDHWLKGKDTGIMNEPAILLFIQGANKWRYEHEWPLNVTQWTKFYLAPKGRLSTREPVKGSAPAVFTSNPWAMEADPVPKAIFETEALAQNLEVTGPVALHWYASILSRPLKARSWKGPASDGVGEIKPLTNNTDWYLQVKDIDVDGAERLVVEGWLKASRYELDEKRSKPYAPYHPHTRDLPIKPGEPVYYASDLRMTSNVFLAGHKVRLEIAGQDSPHGLGYHLPHMAEVEHTVYTDSERPSYLLLPVIPCGYVGAGEPDFPPAGPFRMPRYRR
ncbi:MAG: CocE/NonD family hydrolase [Chloroflexi bacterium]|nr:CocE/NonD family hydrolase [Chloroflexota bacterium]